MDAHLAAFDDAWAHDWESVTSALANVSVEEALWQAPCYASEPQEPGMPPAGTIAWHVAHVAQCKRYYAAVLRHPGKESPPVPPPGPLADFADALAELRAAHADQRRAMEALTPEALTQQAGNRMAMPEFVRMTVRHDSWHAGQMALARRLWRMRPDAAP